MSAGRSGEVLAGAQSSDRRMLLALSAIVLVLIVGVSVFAPRESENDDRPSSTNAGPEGAKAAYLTLQSLGWRVSRWEQPLDALSGVDAAHTTLVLAEPEFAGPDRERLSAALKLYLSRGGRVLTTGPLGAQLLPGGESAPAGLLSLGLCRTTAEGQGELARAGSVLLKNGAQWSARGAQFVVDQRCGREAVVVHLEQGAGEAVWWSSPDPLRNRQLATAADLRLLLASLGTGRAILFDDALHLPVPSAWDATGGLPLGWLAAQTALLFALLVFSFSRRHGPVRLPVVLPRSSPAEFAHSMGDLYAKGHATSAATDAARRMLLRVVVREAGVSPAVVQQGAMAVSEALSERLTGDWSPVAEHLQAAEDAGDRARAEISETSGLRLVQALKDDAESIRRALRPERVEQTSRRELSAEAAEAVGVRE